MIKQYINAQDVCSLLNEFLKLDPECVRALLSYREKCNETITQHPTIQIFQNEGEPAKVGFLGLINGMFGVREDGRGMICYEIDQDTNEIKSFKLTPKPHIEF